MGQSREVNGPDDDDIPAEFRFPGGPTGLGDFVILSGQGQGKQGKSKGKKKKATNNEEMDMDPLPFSL